MPDVAGRGSFDLPLGPSEIRRISEQALSSLDLANKRVLVLIPDHTRHARIDQFFHLLHDVLGSSVQRLDYLIATGTHADMDPERIYQHVGISKQEHETTYKAIRFFNHEHSNPAALATIGRLEAGEVKSLTNGVFSESIDVTINRKVLEYDHILMITPVVTHESMGFAGGNKYFFPGISGLEVLETFHWLAAMITNPVVNGVKDTPTRRVIDRASEFIPTPRTCFAFAVNDRDELMCLFVGEPKAAWSRAADYSAKLHIDYKEHLYKTVLAVTPPIYEDMWVGGKAMYKLEPVLADGGEIIIYGPQIRSVSFIHERAIRRVGYHVVEYFTKQWDRFAGESRLILAHSTNVRGIGTYSNGRESPRVRVTLATSIPEEVCRSVNLGYQDYRTIDIGQWKSRQNGDLMVVENAGQVLYRVKA
ncbi:MAG TPA: lactate racemase domain-containing protein [Bacteroidota bacterium]